MTRALFIIFAAGTFVASGHAQSPEETATARALFEEGVRLGDADDWEGATDRFERALQLRAHPNIALNLGLAYLRLDRFVAASEQFRQVLRMDAAPRLRHRAEQELERTLPRLARLTLWVEGGDAVIHLDGRPVEAAMLGVASPVDPGPHRAEALRDGEVVAEATTTLAEGEARELRLVVPEAPVDIPTPEEAAEQVVGSDPPPIVDDPEPALWRRWWLWTLVAVGVAAIAGGIVAATRDRQQSPNCELTLGCVEP